MISTEHAKQNKKHKKTTLTLSDRIAAYLTRRVGSMAMLYGLKVIFGFVNRVVRALAQYEADQAKILQVLTIQHKGS